MAMMGSINMLLLMLASCCYCAPKTLFNIGGTLGYDSHINGTIGKHLAVDQDGLSVNGTSRGIVGASWAPTLVARGFGQFGDKVIAGDASLKTVINNSWQPGFQGELGRNSNGKWLAGFQPDSQLHNKFLITPNVQLETGDEARKLAGLPRASEIENSGNVQQQVPVSLYGPAYPYGSIPYGYMPNPSAVPNTDDVPNPYAAYAQVMAQYQQMVQYQQMIQRQMAQLQAVLKSPNAYPEQPIEQQIVKA